MSVKITNLSLPEWAWVSGGDHEPSGDPLEGRNVVLHVRSATVIELLEEDSFMPAPGVKTFKFTYRNFAGVNERHIAVLHYSAACDDAEILEEILESAAEWYCDYMKWEDNNIATSEIAPLN